MAGVKRQFNVVPGTSIAPHLGDEIHSCTGLFTGSDLKSLFSPIRINISFFLLLSLAFAIPYPVPTWGLVQVVGHGDNHLRILYTAEGNDWRNSLRRCVVGIPPEGGVSMEVVKAVETSTQSLTEAELDELTADFRLQGPAELGEQGYLRDQRITTLVFAPALTTGGIILYEQVLVDVRFSGGGGTRSPSSRDSWGEELYRNSLINYEQARKWRAKRSRPASRAAMQFGTQRVRMTLRDEGIYRVTGQDLVELGVGLNGVNSRNLRVVYGGGKILPLEFPEQDFALEEWPIVVEDGGDGMFDADDFLLFNGEAVARFEVARDGDYQYVRNPYTLDNVYWLEIGEREGLRAAQWPGAPTAVAPVFDTYRVRIHQESEKLILLQTFGMNSGYEWYWEDFQGNARNYSIRVQNPAPGPVDIRLAFYGWTDVNHRFDVKWNSRVVENIVFTGIPFAVTEVRSGSGPVEGLNTLGLVHTDGSSGRVTRFDWYEVDYNRQLVAERGELIFDSPVFDGNVEFSLRGFKDEQPRVFESSTGLREIVEFEYDGEAGTVLFQDQGGATPRHYLVAGPSRWKRPTRFVVDSSVVLQTTDNGADYVIITHEDFSGAAERLADWRAEDDRFSDRLTPIVVDIRDIYDEFSGGLVDPTAIRNFLLYAANNWSIQPMFVNLFGDGSYDYKNNSGTSPGNWIPPYQDGDSTYDEWYVRVAGDDQFPDMAIGRLTVQNPAEAENVVNKLITYDRQPEAGAWQSRALMVADDISNPSNRDLPETFFLTDTEVLSNLFLPTGLDVIKHYIGRFALEGQTKPRARDEFIRLFNEGAAILTYVGHGNPDVLAHEQMFVVSRDAADIKNEGRLPLMYTAASQVGVFDDPVRSSMPEVLLNKTDGGVIGMISATRVGFHGSNIILARNFHNQMYRTSRTHVPVGLALMEAKVRSQGGGTERGQRNIQRYSLIGDPATRLVLPRYTVEMVLPDTLRALQEVQVTGRVFRPDGVAASEYQGTAVVQAFDSAEISRLEDLSYLQLGSPLFRGTVEVKNGRFEAGFRVPKDITYKGVRGRVSAYLWSEEQPPAFGSVEGLQLVGTEQGVEPDQRGPEISVTFVGQQNFKSGGFVPTSPVLLASISDDGGINVTGETGHEILLTVDEAVTKVTESFTNATGTYREGTLKYQITALEPGEHVIRLKAWDSFNNSSVTEVEVRVGAADDVIISDVLFYPNPLDGRARRGHFTFNLFNPTTSLRVQVFSLSGRQVDEVEAEPLLGYNQVEWQPPADLANGTYLYRISVTSRNADGRVGKAVKTAAFQVMQQ
jgi:hypothetical protein